ncbi:MAG: lipid II:glycine glycyltransferase FemX [Bacteroidota bacterium]
MGKKYEFCSVSPDREGKERWQNLLSQARYMNYLAAMPYEYTRSLNGRRTVTYIVTHESRDVAGFHLSLKDFLSGLFRTADILSGLVLADEPDEELLDGIARFITGKSREFHATFLRINTWLPGTYSGSETSVAGTVTKAMVNNGLKKIRSGRWTYWIDLSTEEEKLLGAMKAQTRRKIRQAAGAEILVETTDEYDDEKVSEFYELYWKLGNRKQFGLLSEQRFREEVKALFESGATLFFLKYKGITINVALATRYNYSSYYHGALNPVYKELEGCPSPGHFMQWTMIRYMKEKGLSRYDMAYCPGPVPVEGHPSFDMWRFKYGFGGDAVEFLPVYGKSLQPLRGRIFQFLYRNR